MFRCPSCARSWKLKLTKQHWLLMSKNMNKMTIERDPITISSHVATASDAQELAKTMNTLDLDFEQTDMVEGSPVMACPFCKEEHSLMEWNKAWEYPGDFFDADALCSCGGELWWSKIPGTPRFAHVCEECGWAKPNATISGAARLPEE